MSSKMTGQEFVTFCIEAAKEHGINCIILADGAAGINNDDSGNIDYKALRVLVPDIITRISSPSTINNDTMSISEFYNKIMYIAEETRDYIVRITGGTSAHIYFVIVKPHENEEVEFNIFIAIDLVNPKKIGKVTFKMSDGKPISGEIVDGIGNFILSADDSISDLLIMNDELDEFFKELAKIN